MTFLPRFPFLFANFASAQAMSLLPAAVFTSMDLDHYLLMLSIGNIGLLLIDI